jgi:hypothetical protein
MKIEVFKHGKGFLPASEDAQRVYARMSPGEIVWVKVLRIRDPVSHRRYWQLMTMCADNCERIKLPYGGVMLIHNKNDVHTAIKLCTGHCITIFDANGTPAFQIPKSTDYENMTADEWAEYLPRVYDVIQARILPGVSLPEMELEILKCMGMAA